MAAFAPELRPFCFEGAGVGSADDIVVPVEAGDELLVVVAACVLLRLGDAVDVRVALLDCESE